MKSLHKFILVLGILMTAGGVAGAGLLYRSMKTENLIHARTGMVTVNLAKSGDWKNTTFTLYRPGSHILNLSMVNKSGVPSQSTYKGEFEVQVLAPDGTTALQTLITPGMFDLRIPDSTRWIVLDSLQVGEPTQRFWTLRTRVSEADTSFSKIQSELSILPPQQYDIESYLSGEMLKLIGMGAAVLMGFVLVVFSGFVRKKTM